MKPIFWQPANANGMAATVYIIFDNQSVKVNFYWSGIGLAIEPQTHEQLADQIHEFFIRHPLTNLNGRSVFYLRRSDDDFIEIADPGWSPRV